MTNQKIIYDVLKFAKKLIGAPRGNDWKTYKLSSNTCPMWACDEPLPKISVLKKDGMVCTGLINLMRRKAGLSVLILNKDPTQVLGGTLEWFEYLKNKNRLQVFDINNMYPMGTMLLRNFNQIDHGHLAVIYKENKKGVLFSSLIHSVGWNDGSGKQIVKIDASVHKSHFAQYNGTTNTGHYTHICLPENWLIKE